jgi:hypothetical protein
MLQDKLKEVEKNFGQYNKTVITFFSEMEKKIAMLPKEQQEDLKELLNMARTGNIAEVTKMNELISKKYEQDSKK